jgi:sugar phosphate isomerase/epimerase
MKNQIKSIIVLACCVIGSQSFSNPPSGNNSKLGGVQVGAITYSFRDMPDQSLQAILDYSVQAGLNSIELMGGPVEQYLGIPAQGVAGQFSRPGDEAVRQWRTTVSMDKFKEIKKMFAQKGIKINILRFGDPKWTDAEIDYAFKACKAIGAKGISLDIGEEAAKRMEPFAAKYNLYAILHNHGEPGNPDFSFDKILAYGPHLMLNFDAGHYYGATGLNPCDLIKRLHGRIVSLHIKDKTGPKDTPADKATPFGQGTTPVKEILQLVQKEKWPIECDIELEYAIPAGSDAVQEVKKCVDYCRTALVTKNK